MSEEVANDNEHDDNCSDNGDSSDEYYSGDG